jgi:predicted deacetylase
LISFLLHEQERGSEIVLHGFTHRRSGPWQQPWRRQLRARLFSPNDAEFLSLSPVEIEARLGAGRSILEGAGLSVRGFAAPGWLASRELRPLLRRLGFRYDIAMTHVVDLQTHRRIWTDWIGYMGTGGLQERLVGIANLINRGVMPRFPVAKVFLHPQQARRSSACRRVLASISALLHERRPATYYELFAADDQGLP